MRGLGGDASVALESTAFLDREDEDDVGALVEGLVDFVFVLRGGGPNALCLGQRHVFEVVRLHEEEPGVAEDVLRKATSGEVRLNTVQIFSEATGFSASGSSVPPIPLDASSRLYKKTCPFIRPSVGCAFVKNIKGLSKNWTRTVLSFIKR